MKYGNIKKYINAIKTYKFHSVICDPILLDVYQIIFVSASLALRKLRLTSIRKRNDWSTRISSTTEVPNLHQLLSLVRRDEVGGNYKQWRKMG